MGAWSSVVEGLRGRLITSGSRPDRSALRLSVELQNVSGHGPLEIHWNGRLTLGYLSFRLEDATGTEVPAPGWAFGGNEFGGHLLEIIPPTGTVRHDVEDNLFGRGIGGGRVVRVGVFWAREMPADGSRRFFRGRATGGVAASDEMMMQPEVGTDGGVIAGAVPPGTPRGHVWSGPLELPPVCVD